MRQVREGVGEGYVTAWAAPASGTAGYGGPIHGEAVALVGGGQVEIVEWPIGRHLNCDAVANSMFVEHHDKSVLADQLLPQFLAVFNARGCIVMMIEVFEICGLPDSQALPNVGHTEMRGWENNYSSASCDL